MKAMLIVAHGSRKSNSNDEIRQLTDKVTQRVNADYDLIDCAFLELADPSIEAGIDKLVQQGAKCICVVPYFLARGTHVANDIPTIIASSQEKHAEIELIISDYLGQSDMMVDALLSVATPR